VSATDVSTNGQSTNGQSTNGQSAHASHHPGARADLIGIAAMAGGNALLVVNDTFVKLAAGSVPMSQVIFLRAVVATALLFLVVRLTLQPGAPWPRLTQPIIIRGLFEVGASFAYLYALQLIPIGDLAGLQQVIPLAILAGAAVVFREPIGWRGWAAALVGLFGALLIVGPGFGAGLGTSGASITGVGALLAALAVIFQVVRDLLTRALPNQLPPAFVAGTSQSGMIIGGLCLAPFDGWSIPSALTLAEIVGASTLLATANYWLVTAMRSGRIGIVGPFRYAGLLAALASGWIVWGEFPSRLSLLGSAILVASGLASLWLRPRGGT
jgi:drug/metabolite transporter (DMT)-like permease